MNAHFTISVSKWNTLIGELTSHNDIYAPYRYGNQIEYSLVSAQNVAQIVYNIPKPASPLKIFFLPVKENVVNPSKIDRKRIIIGAPACDLEALSILDEIYLNNDYVDPNYSKRRENTLLIGFDCHSHQEHCHCTTYGFHPYPESNADIVLSKMDDKIIIAPKTEKGSVFRENYIMGYEQTDLQTKSALERVRETVVRELEEKNEGLPDYRQTGDLVVTSEEPIWRKYAETCVSCGACSAICPTCSCFLFIERPEFEKVRTLDTCQYPGFERVAAGEDPLRPLHKRFRNRYMCKYVWKPEKFESKACTGCGRCIEACIGEINKNDLFRELKQNQKAEV